MFFKNFLRNTTKHVLNLFKKKKNYENILIDEFHNRESKIFYKNNKKIIELSLSNIRNNKAYFHKEISKKNGGKRRLSIPDSYTKVVQKKINILLTKFYHAPKSVYAFVKSSDNKKNIVTNAYMHINKKIVINVDIENFFNSINFGRVRGLLMSYPYNIDKDLATKIAQLTIFNNQLPQGAPSSPVISNMICYKLDKQLMHLAKEYRCMYTRYADDITFSTNDKYLNQKAFFKELNKKINENGFSLNSSKTRVQKYCHSQIVTGLKVNEKVNLSKKYIRQIRSMLHSLHKDGLAEASVKHFKLYNIDEKYSKDKEKSFKRILRGKIDFMGMVLGKEDYKYKKSIYLFYLATNNYLPLNYYQKLEKMNSEDEDFLKLSLQEMYSSIVVFTEGETDITYLKAALNFFHSKDKFLELKIRFVSLGGFPEVIKYHKAIFLTKNDNVTLELREKLSPYLNKSVNYYFLLDADDPDIKNYFNKTYVPNSFYLIMEKTDGYIEKCFQKELIKDIINKHGYKIEPEKSTKQKVTNQLLNHLRNNSKKDDFFSIDSYIVYAEKQIFKTILAKYICDNKEVDYSVFKDFFDFIIKNKTNNLIPTKLSIGDEYK